MENLVRFGCKNCFSPHLRERDGKLHCISCGAVFEKNVETDEERDARILYLSRLDSAEKHLRMSPPRFDTAEAEFRDFIKHYPKHSDGYWGLVRARYEIKFESDINGKEVPSCYKSTYDDFRRDQDYQKALKYAENNDIKNKYAAMAELIAAECKEWAAQAKKQGEYDVFISFKASEGDENTPTQDMQELKDLYAYLLQLGYKVFFSPMSMKDKGGKYYDPYILNALRSAKVMLVYGSKAEYFSSTWVQNEWTRYLKMMADGEKEKGSCIVAYKNFNANELPRDLRRLQAINAAEVGFDHFLVEKINSILKKNEKRSDDAKEDLKIESQKKTKQDEKDLQRKREELRLLQEKNKLDKQIEEQQKIAYENEERARKEKELADNKRHLEERKQKIINSVKNVSYTLQNGAEDIMGSIKRFVINNKKGVIIASVSLLVALGLSFGIYGLVKNGNDGGNDGYYEEEDDGTCEHIFGDWSVVKHASETEAGEKVRSCFECGFEDRESIPKIDHTHVWSDWVVVKDATEEAEGEKMRSCTKCEYEEREAIPKSDHVHDITAILAVEATCTSTGKTEGAYCSKCEMILTSQKITPMNHSFVDGACKYCGTTDVPSIGLAMTQSGDGYMVTGIGDCLDTKVVIPMMRNGLPVIGIKASAFEGAKIIEIVIPASVTTIGNSAFKDCTTLTKVTIQGSLVDISDKAFWDCTALKEVDIKGSVKAIGGGAFYNCQKLTEIILPVGIESIDNSVKYDYDNYGAFQASGLQKITIGDETSDIEITIGDRAFFRCRELSEVYLGNGVVSIGRFAFYESGVKTITLSENLETIGNGAFACCLDLEEITIPEKVKAIPDRGYLTDYSGSDTYYGTFQDCTSLRKVTIKGELDIIGTMAFWDCTALSEVVIEKHVKTIGGGAFYNCQKLTEITLPAGIESIAGSVKYSSKDYGAFQESGLQKITIGDETSDIEITIGDRAFFRCCELSEVYLGNGVVSIGIFAFYESGVKTITLSDNLETMGSSAFARCTNLLEITIPEKVKVISDRGYLTNYSGGGTYYGTFQYCTSLRKVTIKGELDIIGTMAFWDCTALSEVVIEKHVKTIGGGAFYNCQKLTEITLPAGIESIAGSVKYSSKDYGAFQESGLQKITIGDETSDIEITIGDRAFFKCYELSEVYLGNGVISIGEFAFYYSGIKTIDLGDNLETIGNAAFACCRNLEEITIPEKVKAIPDKGYLTNYSDYGAFEGCTSLKKVTIAGNTGSIGSQAFKGCTALVELYIGNNVKTIGMDAFSDCTALRDIYFLGTSAEWENMTRDEKWRQNTNITGIHYAE